MDALKVNRENVDGIFYVDTDDPRVINPCIKKTEEYLKTFRRWVCKVSGNMAPSEVRLLHRRDRIVEAHTKIKELLLDDSKYIFGVEDDTLFPEWSVNEMMPVIVRPDCGFIEGVQVGRWSLKYVGAWRVDKLKNPKKILSMPCLDTREKEGRFIEKIDAGGFYCFMTKTELYKKHKFRWEGDCFGPDVVYGLDLRKKGYNCYIDWSLVTGHNDDGLVLWPDEKSAQAVYNKVRGNWEMEKCNFQKK